MFYEKTKKIAMCIEYDGSNYYGWQRQEKIATVQETIEKAISKIANHSVNVFCAGRTDTGVHSTGQIIHFETNANRNISAWTKGVNSNLPNSISVLWVKNVSNKFHARFSAVARRYRYIIYNYSMRPAILNNGLTHCYYPLNIQTMQYSSRCLLGEHDFSAFCGSPCQSINFKRNIIHLNIIRLGYYVIIDIKANAFLYHMVRNIVGNLIDIGIGKKPSSWMRILLLSKNRTFGCSTAKAKGLYLVEVEYPAYFCLPRVSIGPLFLQNIKKMY
ncbi:tRNA pseudouridine(38-40) synthase TruA [Candidatus Pantoea edessiphila]|uniref:tRNA pseudouridine synthase A n=1 Tax=Candidatus Pantoea edessiphila TaxID=2044610 RepID=A0A2P5SYH7_9GAMM|nr:tRNA pseudouridine(38-40) synthase TruA [Candidatus Pantoea edessiphila]MBK4775485.1 tRNA pseudouridine(38-40) synthase TruA [Pantoea sp. Edef]PPI87386.1 tRNA pseudouridine(38-40) synthase TruA [Candidatus Pantoea edessiphila]